MNTQEFGPYIKEARFKQGISLRELGAAQGVTPSYISLIENGIQERLSVEIFVSLINGLHLDFFKSFEMVGVHVKEIDLAFLKDSQITLKCDGVTISKKDFNKFLAQCVKNDKIKASSTTTAVKTKKLAKFADTKKSKDTK